MGVAAAVLIGVVVASGNLPGPIERITHLGHTSSASPSATHTSGGNPASPGLQGTGAAATKPATPDPTATHGRVIPSPTSSPAPSRLCQEYYGYFTHPESRASWAAEMSLYRQLGELAGSSDPNRVLGYCRPYLGNMFHRGDSGTGSQNSQSQGKGPGSTGQASQSLRSGSARTGQGDTGSGNGSSGSGQGSQGGGGPVPNP